MYSRFLIVLSLANAMSLVVMEKDVWAHAYPAVSSPANNATLREGPREVRIQFTEGVEIAFSQITVKRQNGEVVSQGKLRQLADDTVATDLKPLALGTYVIEWQVLSVDTHVTEGVLRFSVSTGTK
jgi:methionine-rich copper-binding protein CopC